MFGSLEFHDAPARPRPDAGIRTRHGAPVRTPAADSNRNIPMLGAVRVMLGLAVEGAFDLRMGHANSDHLRRFNEMRDQQIGLLDSLEHGDFSSDPGLLTHRAQEALDGFATAVRQEIIEYVYPGIDPAVFDAALQRMTDRAIVAGAAFASLDLALDRPL